MRGIARNFLFFGASALHLASYAAGLGELRLFSHLGQPLYAEVALIDPEKELSSIACFRLEESLHSEIPHVTDGRFELKNRGGKKILLIHSRSALNEPALILSLRVNCGMEIRRDYTLIPELHMVEPDTSSAEVSGSGMQISGGDVRPARPGRVVERRIIEASGEQTLRQVVRSLRPHSPSAERWLYKKMASLNPEWRFGQVIPSGTEIIVPRLRDYSGAQTSDAIAEAEVQGERALRPDNQSEAIAPSKTRDALALRAAIIEKEFLALNERIQALQRQTELLNSALAEVEAAVLVEEQRLAASELKADEMAIGPIEPAPENDPESPPVAVTPAPAVRVSSDETPPASENEGGFGWLELVLAALGAGLAGAVLAYAMAARRFRR